MTMPLQRTLEHLRAELSTRLGFGLQTLTTAHKNILTSFLTSTQQKLYRLMDDETLRVVDLSLATAYLQGIDIEFTPGTPGVPATITSTTTDLSAHGPGIVRVRSTSGLNDGDYRVSQATTNTLTLWPGEVLATESPPTDRVIKSTFDDGLVGDWSQSGPDDPVMAVVLAIPGGSWLRTGGRDIYESGHTWTVAAGEVYRISADYRASSCAVGGYLGLHVTDGISDNWLVADTYAAGTNGSLLGDITIDPAYDGWTAEVWLQIDQDITAPGEGPVDWRNQSCREVSSSLTVTLYLYAFPWPSWLDPAELFLRGTSDAVSARIDDNGPWLPLENGLTVHHESDIDLDQVGYPLAWDVYGRTPGQVSFLRVWPLPDDAYPLRIAARRRLNAFRGDLSAWAPNTAYALGAIVVPRSAPAWPLPLRDVDSFYYVCVDPGTSHGTTEPTWPTEEGAQVIDNPAGAAVVWEAVRNDCTLDQDLVLLGALALAKAHFRQADAQVAAQDFLEARRSLTGQAHGERTYSRTASRSTARRPLGQGGRIIGLGIGLAPDD